MRFVFPSVLVLAQIGAAVVCTVGGDWRRALYWAAGAVCAIAVTV